MEKLFSEFAKQDARAWKEQIVRDLKGDAYESLIWHNENDIEIQPFYTAEDLKNTYLPAFTHHDWHISVKESDQGDANRFFLEALSGGASAIMCRYQPGEMDTKLKDVNLDYIQSSFIVAPGEENSFFEWLANNDNACSVIFDDRNDPAHLAAYLKSIPQTLLHTNTICADVLDWHNKGANAVYEIAIAFSKIISVLDEVSPGALKGKVVIRTGVNSDYFIQMAKLRAMRRLWEVIRKEYSIQLPLYIIADTSLTNKSISDAYNNLLRTTVEAMAAVSGGCNELVVHGFDHFIQAESGDSNRLAINQQLILKEESYLDRMADVACGSYFIEYLTDQLSLKGLDIIKKISTGGGFFAQTDDLLKSVEHQYAARKEMFDNQKQLAIGVNKYRNEKEKTDLNAAARRRIKDMNINNAALAFELGHFFL